MIPSPAVPAKAATALEWPRNFLYIAIPHKPEPEMDECKLRNLAIRGVLAQAAYDELGIYPLKVTGGEGAYEKRTERMEGWNDAVSAGSRNREALETWYVSLSTDVRDQVADLLLEGKLRLGINDGKCAIEADCSDMFFWGCSDSEEVRLEELPAFIRCWEEAPGNGGDLWVCRKRALRPQGAYYSLIGRQYWPLFDACGPERETGLGNPYRPGEHP